MNAELPRMTSNQARRAKSLISTICSNYDRTTGNCLALDRVDTVRCPQSLTKSVCCKHFRDVILEDKEGRSMKAELFRDERMKPCSECGSPFQPKSNRAKYCPECAKKIRLQKQRQYMAKKRLGV